MNDVGHEPGGRFPRRDGRRFAREENGQVIPDPTHVQDGFRPGWLYDLVCTARHPCVTGLDSLPCATPFRSSAMLLRTTRATRTRSPARSATRYAFDTSQSGRFLNHFVYERFNVDARGPPNNRRRRGHKAFRSVRTADPTADSPGISPLSAATAQRSIENSRLRGVFSLARRAVPAAVSAPARSSSLLNQNIRSEI